MGRRNTASPPATYGGGGPPTRGKSAVNNNVHYHANPNMRSQSLMERVHSVGSDDEDEGVWHALIQGPAHEAGMFYNQIHDEIKMLRSRVDQKLKDMIVGGQEDVADLNRQILSLKSQASSDSEDELVPFAAEAGAGIFSDDLHRLEEAMRIEEELNRKKQDSLKLEERSFDELRISNSAATEPATNLTRNTVARRLQQINFPHENTIQEQEHESSSSTDNEERIQKAKARRQRKQKKGKRSISMSPKDAVTVARSGTTEDAVTNARFGRESPPRRRFFPDGENGQERHLQETATSSEQTSTDQDEMSQDIHDKSPLSNMDRIRLSTVSEEEYQPDSTTSIVPVASENSMYSNDLQEIIDVPLNRTASEVHRSIVQRPIRPPRQFFPPSPPADAPDAHVDARSRVQPDPDSISRAASRRTEQTPSGRSSEGAKSRVSAQSLRQVNEGNLDLLMASLAYLDDDHKGSGARDQLQDAGYGRRTTGSAHSRRANRRGQSSDANSELVDHIDGSNSAVEVVHGQRNGMSQHSSDMDDGRRYRSNFHPTVPAMDVTPGVYGSRYPSDVAMGETPRASSSSRRHQRLLTTASSGSTSHFSHQHQQQQHHPLNGAREARDQPDQTCGWSPLGTQPSASSRSSGSHHHHHHPPHDNGSSYPATQQSRNQHRYRRRSHAHERRLYDDNDHVPEEKKDDEDGSAMVPYWTGEEPPKATTTDRHRRHNVSEATGSSHGHSHNPSRLRLPPRQDEMIIARGGGEVLEWCDHQSHASHHSYASKSIAIKSANLQSIAQSSVTDSMGMHSSSLASGRDLLAELEDEVGAGVCVKIEKVQNHFITDPYGDTGRYTGLLVKEQPYGHGSMHYDDGRSYTGEWKHGRWHGKGRTLFVNGDFFVGEYAKDQRHGLGRYEWSDGRVYDGQFRRDKREGKGTYTWPDGAIYTGDFKAGQRHGQGCYKFKDGSVYTGEFLDGLYHGVGECVWADGRCYRGEWSRGHAHGYGIELRPDGSVRHDGEWKSDRPVKPRDLDASKNEKKASMFPEGNRDHRPRQRVVPDDREQQRSVGQSRGSSRAGASSALTMTTATSARQIVLSCLDP